MFDNEHRSAEPGWGDVVNDLPGYVWVIVWIGVVSLPAATLVVLARGARLAGVSTRTTAAIVAVAGAVWAAWLGGSVALSEAGVYRADPTTANPWVAVALLAVLAAALLGTRIPVVARILADTGPPAPAGGAAHVAGCRWGVPHRGRARGTAGGVRRAGRAR